MKIGKIIMLSMIGAAMASCTSDDDLSPVQEQCAISFSGAVQQTQGQVSRASSDEVGLETVTKSFVVNAYKNGYSEVVMNTYDVNYVETSAGTTTSNTNGWEYVGQGTDGRKQVIKYWDENATNYTFFAYVRPENENEYGLSVQTPSETSSYRHIVKFTDLHYIAQYKDGKKRKLAESAELKPVKDSDIPLYSEPWYRTKETLNTNEPVKLVFHSPYAKINVAFERIDGVESAPVRDITFKPNSGSIPARTDVNCSYNFDGTYTVALSGPDDRGHVFTDNGLTFKSLERPKEVGGEEGETVGIMDDSNTLYMAEPSYWLFPSASNSDFTLSAFIGSGLQKCIVPAAYMKWEIGYEYTYVFKITKAGLNLINVIKVGIKSWNSMNEEERAFHNW